MNNINHDEFKSVLGSFATGVTVVTTRLGEQRTGITVNAFCSVSLDPPLVLVCIQRSSHIHNILRQSGIFAVNILADHQRDLSSCFARNSDYRCNEFCGAEFRTEATGAPVLNEALAFIDCRISNISPAGDHSIFLGVVVALGSREDMPLLYYHGKYGLSHLELMKSS